MSRAKAQRRASANDGFPDSQATGVAKKYTKKMAFARSLLNLP